MIIRAARDDEIASLIEFPGDPSVSGVDETSLREDFAEHRMRPEWTWLVDDGTQVVARALWWGRTDSSSPLALDALDVLPGLDEPVRWATALLRAGHAALAEAGASSLPAYTLRLPRRWRGDHDIATAVHWRRAAAHDVGLTDSVERLQYAWTPQDGIHDDVPLLRFRPGTDEEFLELFAQVAVGSLDVGTVRGLLTTSPEEQAREEVDFYLSCPGEREWWTVALGDDGARVGIAIPSATPYHCNVGYLGVLTAFRGRGLVDALLHEVTRSHAARGATRVTATTDVTNGPMAAAFDRAHYRVTEVRLVLEAPEPRAENLRSRPGTGTPSP